MHTYKPPRENKLHVTLPVLLLILSLLFVWAAQINPLLPPSALQFFSVASIAVAIHIITRYSLTEFAYTVDGEKKLLKVVKIVGKKTTVTAAIDIANITAIDKKVKGYSPKKKYKKSMKRHNFCANISPQNAYCFICNVEGDEFAVMIECDALFLGIIKEQIKRVELFNKGDTTP